MDTYATNLNSFQALNNEFLNSRFKFQESFLLNPDENNNLQEIKKNNNVFEQKFLNNNGS